MPASLGWPPSSASSLTDSKTTCNFTMPSPSRLKSWSRLECVFNSPRLFFGLCLVQHTLGTRHFSFPSCDRTRRHPQRNRQRLERALRSVMIVIPPQAIHMHRNPRMQRETLQAMRQHLARQIAYLLPLGPQIYDRIRPIRQIHHRARQRFVQRCVCVSESRETCCGFEGGFEGLSKCNAGVFGCVVVVDVQVAFCCEVEGPAGVFCQCVQHVVEKADAG